MRRRWAAVIAETPGRLARVLQGVSAAQADVPLAPGKWCLREVVAHLADCEIAFGWRLRQVLAEDHVVLQPFDQDTWTQVYGAYSYAVAWETYKAMRAWNMAFVGSLTEAEKERTYLHPKHGEGCRHENKDDMDQETAHGYVLSAKAVHRGVNCAVGHAE